MIFVCMANNTNNNKTKLQARWEQSFQEFDELFGSRSSTSASRQSISDQHNQEEAVFIEDEEAFGSQADYSILRKQHDFAQTFNLKEKTPASQEIDSFIHDILEPVDHDETGRIGAQSPEVVSVETAKENNTITTPGSTYSIDNFIKRVLAPDPQLLGDDCEESSEEAIVLHSQKHDERPSQDSALLFSSSSANASVNSPDSVLLKEKFISLPSDTGESTDDRLTIVVSPTHTGSVTSQLIDCSSSALAPEQSEEGAVSEGPASQPISVSSQAIHNELDDSLNENLLELTRSSATASSVAQTPDIHSKLSGVVREEECADVDSDPTKKLKMTGMADQLVRIIKREQSDYSITRHQVAMISDEVLDTPTSIEVPSMKLVVTEVVVNADSLIDCVVVSCPNNSISVGTQAKLAASSLGIEGKLANRGEEITLYEPWRVFISLALGPVIFSSSYCEVRGLSESSGQTEGPKATDSVTITALSCPCATKDRAGIYPVYQGPYAFLHQ